MDKLPLISLMLLGLSGCNTLELDLDVPERGPTDKGFCQLLTEEVSAGQDAVSVDQLTLHSGAAWWAGDPSVLMELPPTHDVTVLGDLDDDGLDDLLISSADEARILPGSELTHASFQDLPSAPDPTQHVWGATTSFDIDGDEGLEVLTIRDERIVVYDGLSLLSGELLQVETLDLPDGCEGMSTRISRPDLAGDAHDDLRTFCQLPDSYGQLETFANEHLAVDLHAGFREPTVRVDAPNRIGDLTGDGLAEFTLDASKTIWDGTAATGVTYDLTDAEPLLQWSNSLVIQLTPMIEDISALMISDAQESHDGCPRYGIYDVDSLPQSIDSGFLDDEPEQPYRFVSFKPVGDLDGDGLSESIGLGHRNAFSPGLDVALFEGTDVFSGNTHFDGRIRHHGAAEGRIVTRLMTVSDIDGDGIMDLLVAQGGRD